MHDNPRIQSALTVLTTHADLRLRKTVREPDVQVWTSLLPTYGRYETMLCAPPDVLRDYLIAYGDIEVMTDTVGDAHDAHDRMVRQVRYMVTGGQS